MSAQHGDIPGMRKALAKEPDLLYQSDVFDQQSALHHVAMCGGPDGVKALQWLLNKGVPWSVLDIEGNTSEDVAREYKNEESRKFLREWAVQNDEFPQSLST
jgi:hypothetical protein